MLSLTPSKAARVISREIKTHAAKLRKAGVRTLNKTAAKSKTFAGRDIRQTLNLPASRVSNVISINRANKGRLQSNLRVRRRGVPAVYYRGWKAVKTQRGRRTSTSAKKTKLLKRGSGSGVTVKFRKNRKPVHFPSGFVAVMPNGHLGLYVRKRNSRYPIKEIMGPNVQAIFTENMQVYVRRGLSDLKQIHEREIAYELSRR